MTWAVPTWHTLVLLALATYRSWRLLAEDAIFDRYREPIMRRLPKKAEEGLSCPFCFGFWIALALWLLWQAWPHWTLVAATPFALSAIVGLVAANLDPD